jgi:hypothetical protein
LGGGKRRGGLGDLWEGLTDGIDEEGRPESERVAGGARIEAAGSSQAATAHRQGRRTSGSASRSPWLVLAASPAADRGGGGPVAPTGARLQRAAQGKERRGA